MEGAERIKVSSHVAKGQVKGHGRGAPGNERVGQVQEDMNKIYQGWFRPR